MRILKILMTVMILGSCVALPLYIVHRTERNVRELTIEILRTIPRTFLVLETQREVAVASKDNGNVVFGSRVGHATANRRTHLGVDLEKVSPNDVELSGRRVTVLLPDPEILDTALDYNTVRMFTKRSGLRLLWDLASGKSIESELLDMLGRTPPDYTGEELRAQRQSFVDRLNRQAADLFKAKNLHIEFR